VYFSGDIYSELKISFIFQQINTAESSLLITEPYFNLPNIQDVYDQFMFEEYDFMSYYRCTRTLA
jgi:actin-related protein